MKSFNPNIYSSDKMAHRDRLLTENIEKGPINPSFDISVLKNNDPGPNVGKTQAFASIWATTMKGVSPHIGDNNQIQDSKGNIYTVSNKNTSISSQINLYDSNLDPGVISDPDLTGSLSTSPAYGTFFVVIVKYSPNGEVLWSTYVGSTDAVDSLNNTLMVDSKDNLYMALTSNGVVNYFNAGGKTAGLVNDPTHAGSRDSGLSVHVIKYNTQGQVQWVQTTSKNDAVQYYMKASINSLDEIVLVSSGMGDCTINTITSTSPGTVGVQNQYALLTGMSSSIIFIYTINENGACKWATFIKSFNPGLLYTQDLYERNFTIDNNNNINILFMVSNFMDSILFYNANNAIPNNPTPSGSITAAGTTDNAVLGERTLSTVSFDQNGIIRFATITSITKSLGTPEHYFSPMSIACNNDKIYIESKLEGTTGTPNDDNILFFNAEPLSAGNVVNPLPSGNISLLGKEGYTTLFGYDNRGIIKSFTYYTGTSFTIAINESGFRIPIQVNNSNLYVSVFMRRLSWDPANFFSSAPLIGINVQNPIPAGSFVQGNIDYSIIIKFNSELVIQWSSFVHELYNVNRCIPTGIIFDSIGNPYFCGIVNAVVSNSNLGFYSPNTQGEVSLSQTLSLSFPNPDNYSNAWIAKYNDTDGSLINGINTHFSFPGSYIILWHEYKLFKATIYNDEVYSSFPIQPNPTRYFNHYDGTSVVDPVENFAGSITLDTEGQFFLVVNKYGNIFLETPDYLIKPTYEINSPIRERVKYIYNDLGYKVLIKTNGHVDNENTKPDLLFGEPGGAITLIPNNGKWTVSSELGFTFL